MRLYHGRGDYVGSKASLISSDARCLNESATPLSGL